MKKWNSNGNLYKIGEDAKQLGTLPVGIYSVGFGKFGFYLERIDDEFEFGHKLYGLETKLINRVIKTWNSTTRNLGVLLNGLKGTGKTVTAKVICNQIKLPVIILNSKFEECNLPEFLNEIREDCVILVDEYEKIFGEDAELLTVMDGILSNDTRKLFLLTTNKTYINENMLQRPSRIRYFKTFKDLSPSVIEEIVDDTLKYQEFKDATINAISTLEIITIDVVKTIIEEVNIHRENPEEFMEVFNVKKITGKYTVYQVITDEHGKENEIEMAKGVKLYPRDFDDDRIGSSFQINGNYVGEILEVLTFDKILIQPYVQDSDGDMIHPRNAEPQKARGKNGKAVPVPMPEPIVVRIETYDSINSHYRYAAYTF
jgi:hypothetical protein